MHIASKSGGTDYGDLTNARSHPRGVSSSTKGVSGGGHPGSSPNISDIMDYISLISAGHAVDFGNLSSARLVASGISNGHGGIFESFPRAPELYSPTGRPLTSGGGVGDILVRYMGNDGSSNFTDIGFIRMASDGNEQDFW